MRIRKHAKLSSLLFSVAAPETPPTHVCQLNQSPWDVIPFASPPYLLGGEDFSFTENGSTEDPLGATQSSIASKNAADDDIGTLKKVSGFDFSSNENDLCNGDNDCNNGNDSDVSYGTEVGDSAVCRKTNGRGWRCTRAAKEGHYLCNYHSRPRCSTVAEKGGSVVTEVTRRRGRPPKMKKAAAQPTATQSNQFYYYSGFGPLWGKRRNERSGAGRWEPPPPAAEGGNSPPTPSSSLEIDGDVDGIDDEEEEVSGDSDGRKRMRKPVKARSLKSLM